MIINHQYQFCFFAIPRTASKAVSAVLKEKFDSDEILKMHTSYEEFMNQASKAEQQYFTFTIIRNPLDSIVSAYHKIKSDHNKRFSRGAYKDGRPIAKRAIEAYRFIAERDASFADYFAVFHQDEFRRPRHETTVQKVDYCLRFENLQEDFNATMNKIGLPSAKIPVYNATKGKSSEFLSYYNPAIIPQAIRVTATIMAEWGYSYPEHWLTKIKLNS